MMKYKAVDRDELIETLGKQCSPVPESHRYCSDYWYVIGPSTVNPRLCHVATCMSKGLAFNRARALNKEGPDRPDQGGAS